MNTDDIATLIHKHRHLLNDRQRYILHMTACDWSSRRIATQLGVCHTTVLADLDRAIQTIRKAAT